MLTLFQCLFDFRSFYYHIDLEIQDYEHVIKFAENKVRASYGKGTPHDVELIILQAARETGDLTPMMRSTVTVGN